MHKLGEFIQQRMDAQGMDRPELQRRSGLTRQHVWKLLDPSSTRLGNMIRPETVTGLAAGLGVDESIIVSKAAEAMGVPVDQLAPVVMTAHDAPNEELLEILLQRQLCGRMTGGSGVDHRRGTNPDQQPVTNDDRHKYAADRIEGRGPLRPVNQ